MRVRYVVLALCISSNTALPVYPNVDMIGRGYDAFIGTSQSPGEFLLLQA